MPEGFLLTLAWITVQAALEFWLLLLNSSDILARVARMMASERCTPFELLWLNGCQRSHGNEF